MSELRVRPVDEGELEGAEQLLDNLKRGDEARASLVRLGGVDDKSLAFGDGWAVAVEVDGASLLVRGEPAGAGARWTIYGQPGLENGMHAARRLHGLVGVETNS